MLHVLLTHLLLRLQAEVDFAADGGSQPPPISAFVTCAAALTEGRQTSSHADDTRGLMTAVLLGGISQDDLTVSLITFQGFRFMSLQVHVT